MSYRTIKYIVIKGLVAMLATLASPSVSRATLIVAPGFDLFETQAGTMFDGNAFVGVPLGSFNFGGTIGVQSTGTADTIVHRLATAGVPGPLPPPQTAAPIPIEMVALHLMSVNPVDLGLGIDFYFVTLQSERGGPASTGSLTITFGPEGDPHGTFDSLINVAFDIRKESLTGPIVLSQILLLTAADIPWNHFAPLGALTISGVNLNLTPCPAGVPNCDFFPTGPFPESEAAVAIHVVQSARAVPEPTAMLLLGFGLLALAAIGRKRLFDKK